MINLSREMAMELEHRNAELEAENARLKGKGNEYAAQIDSANVAMENLDFAMGRNGRLNVGGLVEGLVERYTKLADVSDGKGEECHATGHRRENSLDGGFFACSMCDEDMIHETFFFCQRCGRKINNERDELNGQDVILEDEEASVSFNMD